MLTRTLITLIKKEIPDWSREEIREIINEVHKIILNKRTLPSMRMLAANGKDPVLNTTTGVYSYDIDTVNGFLNNARKIVRVYIEDFDSPEDVTCLDAVGTDPAKVIFKEDPSTTSYYIRAYKKPTEISVEGIAMQIPDEFHFTYVKEGVLGLIEKFRSGKSERWDIFEKLLLPELLNHISETNVRSADTTYKGY